MPIVHFCQIIVRVIVNRPPGRVGSAEPGKKRLKDTLSGKGEWGSRTRDGAAQSMREVIGDRADRTIGRDGIVHLGSPGSGVESTGQNLS
jgi:hypothetical protein